MSRLLAATLLACMPMCPAVLAQEAPSPPEWDMIAFETRSWGEPISSWRLDKSGGGSWAESVRQEGARLGDYTLVFHEIEPVAENYITIERILGGLPQPAPDSNDCANFMTDMVYGTIRLTKGATTTEIAWNSGCMDEDYAPLLDRLREADSLVREWGKASEVLRREEHTVED